MKKLQIIPKHDFVKYYGWIQQIPFVDITPEICLARCLTGQYQGVTGLIKGQPIGIAVYYIKDDMAFIVGLWAKNQVVRFKELFLDYLKKNNIKVIRSVSKLPSESYSKLMGMEKLWSVYERVL